MHDQPNMRRAQPSPAAPALGSCCCSCCCLKAANLCWFLFPMIRIVFFCSSSIISCQLLMRLIVPSALTTTGPSLSILMGVPSTTSVRSSLSTGAPPPQESGSAASGRSSGSSKGEAEAAAAAAEAVADAAAGAALSPDIFRRQPAPGPRAAASAVGRHRATSGEGSGRSSGSSGSGRRPTAEAARARARINRGGRRVGGEHLCMG
mmetsp:Transcript_60104/g.172558  ORF Transcript_60104/g.172558 Transcript_60104/m.172558 type:complete len:206 (+) Transcript_60104:25-642(+)